MTNEIEFGTLHPDGNLTNVRLIKHSDIGRCPHVIMVPTHYRDDGSCKCDDPQEQAMMIREWGYSRADLVQAIHCDHCHCDVLSAHNHKLDEQSKNMKEIKELLDAMESVAIIVHERYHRKDIASKYHNCKTDACSMAVEARKEMTQRGLA